MKNAESTQNIEEDDDDQIGDASQDGEGAAKKKKNRKKKKKGKESAGELEPIQENGIPVHEEQPLADSVPAEPEEWVDITSMCDLASQVMSVGEMIESPNFRLFDAMSAIEIMDPKMDSGFNNSADMTLDRAVESGILANALKHEALIAIWDHLLMYYLLWLEGHTIVQTFLCCLYLHDLEAFVKPIPLFAAFADAFFMTCRQARGAILRAGVYDDEDFLPSMFGFDLEVCAFSAVPKEIKERIDKECKPLRSSKSQAAKAVQWRLEFIAEYMMALEDLVGDNPSNGKNHLESAQRRLTNCLGLIEKLEQSCELADPEALKCFDASINRKLLVPGPPRTVAAIESSRLAFSMWTSRIHELLLCCTMFQKPLAAALEGAVTYKDEPNILPRSIAQIFVQDTPGLIRKLMRDSLDLYLFPEDALQHCKKDVEQFLDQSEAMFSHLFKLTYHNRARRFRRLAHIFTDFNALQFKSWNLDSVLKTTFGANLRYSRSSWVWIMEHCLQMMLTKLFLGFELDLYDEGEFHMIYWYSDYLYGLRAYNLNELCHAKEQAVGGDKKKGRGRQAAQTGRGGQKPRNPSPQLMVLEATQNCVRGLFRLLAFCLREGVLKSPSTVTDGLAQRFVLRFRCLELFRLPHLPSFRDFQASSASAQAPVESMVVLDAAKSSFAESQQLLDKVATALKERENSVDSIGEEAKALKRVVVANQLAITQLMKRLSNGTLCPVVCSLAHHPHFVSIQVQSGA